ncbi:MAG: MbnP family protein [Bacteroidota bacterium]
MKKSILLLAAFAFVFSACDSTVNDDEDGMAMVSFDLDAMVGSTPLSTDAATVYTMDGTSFTMEVARMYISNVELLKADGTTVTFSGESLTLPARDNGTDVTHTVDDKIVLARHDAGESEYMLGEAPAGDYTGIRFNVGVTGLDNHIDVAQVPASHPLAKQTDVNNHWSWNPGFIFLRMDGEVDTNGDGTLDAPWEMHLGTGAYLTPIEVNQNFTLEADHEADLHFMIHYGMFLDGIDLKDADQRNTHVFDFPEVAQKLGANLAQGIMLHGVHMSDGHDHDHDHGN